MEIDNKSAFTLIDGEFDYEHASEVLLSLIDRKIHYHNLENFGHEIRFGKVLEHSQDRILALKHCYKDIQDLIRAQAQNNKRFKISATIEITPID